MAASDPDPVAEAFRHVSHTTGGIWHRPLIAIVVLWAALMVLLVVFGWPGAFTNH